MNVRTPLVVAAVVTAAALTGCSSTATTGSAAPATTAPGTAGSPAAGGIAGGGSAKPAPGTHTPTTKPAGTHAPTGKPAASDGCTPSEATLLKALRTGKLVGVLAPTDTLTEITCYQGYALALTHPKEADNARAVFHYTGGAWHGIGGGTSDYCEGIVPAAVQPHLKHC
ncbi:hypothetical protein ACWT_4011 [Actinoplanes sp. SE50]|uniref:hypothetical protein n=1 Tax=unclassified Actinoplanes TaxID=2626549 RepID=UPI00023ED61F|nr:MULTISPECIES: hypothetical protein [unclassified Actinoplanes]AEV85035.1 hypothetical protein ACPL_4140 [Actinoplanes sp. SE50/110]ATO83426.1 hypothetical protein ACWT_4011 [Actinoplanes sp. SE50]SLM00833.1 alpha-ketoglutarate decarboxylase [Actinoplanes sp. SE50/110]